MDKVFPMTDLRGTQDYLAEVIADRDAHMQARHRAECEIVELQATVDRLRAALSDLLDNMAEDTGQRHYRDKYRTYQVSPVSVENARAAISPAPDYSPNSPDTARASVPADDALWHEAVALVRAQYPEDVFPENGTSLDSKSARMARLTCDNILRRHAQLVTDARDADQPAATPDPLELIGEGLRRSLGHTVQTPATPDAGPWWCDFCGREVATPTTRCGCPASMKPARTPDDDRLSVSAGER
jgi:hypothetical protein